MAASIYPTSLFAAAACGMPALQNSAAAQLKCPRCESTNTKFCYYNNYSLAQPRHFCKTCKRHWTRGGTLRDVPVGGGCRRNKRHKKPQSAIAAVSPNTTPLPRLANSLPLAASDLCSSIFGMPPTNLSSRFFSMFEETIQTDIGSQAVDNHKKSAEAGMSYQAPLPSFDDLPTGICESLIDENPTEGIYSFGGSGSAVPESAFLYSWPEYCSSMVRRLRPFEPSTCSREKTGGRERSRGRSPVISPEERPSSEDPPWKFFREEEGS